MSNPPKARGTRAETAVVRYLTGQGIPAHRVALAGAADHGDIWVAGGRMVIEVKSRQSLPSHTQVRDWRWEASEEASRVPACDISVLIVKRPGSAEVGQWWAWLDHAEWVWISRAVDGADPFWMCLDVATLAVQLIRFGWAE